MSVRRHSYSACALLVFGLIAASRCVWFSEMDFYMHHRVGQWIWEHRTVPRVDYFCFMTLGKPWIAYEWLFELMQYAVQRSAGWTALGLLRVVVAVATYVLVWRTARVLGASRVMALLAPFIAAAFGMVNMEFRPHVATNLFFAAGFFLLTKAAVTQRLRWLIALPVTTALWANMHGGFVAFLVSAMIWCAAEALRMRRGDLAAGFLPPGRRYLATLAAAVLLSFMATLLNPFGWHVWTVPGRILSDARVFGTVYEWLPIQMDQHFPFVILCLIAAALIIANRKSVHPGHVALIAMWAALGWSARRHTALFAIVAAPPICLNLHGLASGRADAEANWKRLTALLGLLVAIFSLAQAWIYDKIDLYPIPRSMGLGMNPTATCRNACEFIRRNALEHQLYNDYNLAGYLIYWLHPGYLVFQDSRLEVVGAELYKRGQAVERGDFPTWRRVFDEREINTVVLGYEHGKEPESLVAQLDRARDFALVYWNDQALVYVRRTAAMAELIAREEYVAVKPGQPTYRGPQDAAGMRAALEEVRRKRREDPECKWAQRLEEFYGARSQGSGFRV